MIDENKVTAIALICLVVGLIAGSINERPQSDAIIIRSNASIEEINIYGDVENVLKFDTDNVRVEIGNITCQRTNSIFSLVDGHYNAIVANTE